MEKKAEAIILCGGRSRRLGRDKAFVTIGGRFLIERVIESLRPVVSCIRLAADARDRFVRFGFSIITDRVAHAGPLPALGAALDAVSSEFCCVAACDMPFLTSDYFRLLLEKIGECDACLAQRGGFPAPLAAVYRRDAARAFLDAAEAGEDRLLPVLRRMDVSYLDEQDLAGFPDRLLLNLNEPEALRRAEAAVSSVDPTSNKKVPGTDPGVI